MSGDAKAPRARPAPIVRLPPPSRSVRDAVMKLLIELQAKRALVELGVLAENESAIPG